MCLCVYVSLYIRYSVCVSLYIFMCVSEKTDQTENNDKVREEGRKGERERGLTLEIMNKYSCMLDQCCTPELYPYFVWISYILFTQFWKLEDTVHGANNCVQFIKTLLSGPQHRTTSSLF